MMNAYPALILAIGLSAFANVLHAATETVVPAPPGSTAFGGTTLVLPNGNFVVVETGFDQVSPAVLNIGVARLYRHDGRLISSLLGSTANDFVGSGGAVVLKNGHFVIISRQWDNGGTADVGAVTWGHAELGFGAPEVRVSSANSLTGTLANDNVGNGSVGLLTNGNYLVMSHNWNNVGVSNAGAVTLCDGATGRVGTVNALNSLVGAKSNDFSSLVFRALNNGNFVVLARDCENHVKGQVLYLADFTITKLTMRMVAQAP